MGVAAAVMGSFGRVALGQEAPNRRLGHGVDYEIPAQALNAPLTAMTMDRFQKTVGDKFSFVLSNRTVTMTLWAVNDLNPLGSKGTATSITGCFGLVFNGPSSPQLGQNTYTVQNSTFGTFSLFIVPGLSTPYNQHYEAIINRI